MSETNYTEEQLTNFLNRVDEYLENKNLGPKEYNDEFRLPETLSLDELRKLDQDDCFNYAMLLSNYMDHINAERAKQEAVIIYCDNSINHMAAREYANLNVYGNQDIKIAIMARENIVMHKLLHFKSTAEARILSLKNKEYNIRKKVDCLLEKGKRK